VQIRLDFPIEHFGGHENDEPVQGSLARHLLDETFELFLFLTAARAPRSAPPPRTRFVPIARSNRFSPSAPL
jgi:hypothetical protein